MAFDHLPKPPRRWAGWWLILILIGLVIVVPSIAVFVTDWLWYRELGRTDIYGTFYWGRWVLGLLVGGVFFALVFGNIVLALRQTSRGTWTEFGQRLREYALRLIEPTLRRLVTGVVGAFVLLFAWGVGVASAKYWPLFLLFTHGRRVGRTDPLFHQDISFYLFRLPMWELIVQWLFTTLTFALVLTVITYLVTRSIRVVRGMPVVAPPVAVHLSVLLGLLFLVKAADYYLGRFGLLFSQHENFLGAGYTDIHARIPGLWIMLVLTLLVGVLMIVNIWRRNILIPLLGFLGLVLASFLVLGVYPGLVQRFRVEPNELALETPYLARHITQTRQAYGLDTVESRQLTPEPRVSSGTLASSPITVNNIRLWDPRPLLETYRQWQVLRTYYTITDVDVDRYTINGQLRQVLLSARELDINQIPGGQSWVNRHLIYTHGYGVIMSPVNEVNEEKGEPAFFIRDIPPVNTVASLRVQRPEIYFGSTQADYAIVRTRQQEFDYPRGDENVYTTYQGRAGISLRNGVVRALTAIRFGALNMLISNYITPDSRIIFRREVVDRAQAAAPFLSFDRDPYMVVGEDGRLYWMLDAFTSSARYPYAAYSSLAVAGGQTVRANYVRNPVKVVVDAYHGTVQCYLVDPNEPFARAWQRVFPHLFRPLAEMPAGLAEHIRVPEGLFNTLSEVYARYHMTAPTTFYSQEDLWEIPQTMTEDASGQSAVTPMEAKYLVMNLYGEGTPEYLLIRPYTPANKKNMIAWLSARNDPGHLGELQVINFPKQSKVNGPQQVEGLINAAPEVSQAVTLWSQSGSRVWKGHLLVIPIGQSVLYVQSLYLLAEQSQIPELQRVIVADQSRVVMRETLDEALRALTGGAVPSAGPPTAGGASVPALSAQQRELVRSALNHYNRAIEAQRNGDWATYGREMEQVGTSLRQVNQ